MRKRKFFIGFVALALHLALLAGCANGLDDGEKSDTILLIESIQPSFLNIDVSTPFDEAVEVSLVGIPRGGASGSDLNDVILESYTVNFSPELAPGLDKVSFPITDGVISGSDTLTLTGVPVVTAGIKETMDANGCASVGQYSASLTFRGRDVLGNQADADGDVTLLMFNTGLICP